MSAGELDPRNDAMIRSQIIERSITDARVIDALRHTPRERFVTPAEAGHAYQDRPLPIGHEQTISQPYIVALMSERLELRPHHRVLEIGTGSGYQTAVLARLAADVFTVERIKPLLDSAFERLCALGLRNVHFRFGDGMEGWPEKAPFDRIVLTAAPESIPTKLLLDQLSDGGLCVLPVGPSDSQMLRVVVRRGNVLESNAICPVRFVPIISRLDSSR